MIHTLVLKGMTFWKLAYNTQCFLSFPIDQREGEPSCPVSYTKKHTLCFNITM